MPEVSFTPRLDVLPPPQRALWDELAATPGDFTLYGGTAIALRLGHRQSVDFDFFSTIPFNPATLTDKVPYLSPCSVLQSEANTLCVSVERQGPVKLAFFGGLRLGQVTTAEFAEGPRISVASLLDLGGTKAAVVTQRAELKDYLDIHALLTQAKLPLADMLAAAAAIYGEQFNPLVSLKAISYHDDETLAELPMAVRSDLVMAVKSVKLDSLTTINPLRPWKPAP
jgi:Nucleotidyl transferase AbiEii toxin, Type IV TA system